MKRKTAIIYESFYDAISDLEDGDFVAMMKAYCNYALNGDEPQLSGYLMSMWKLIKPIIDKNNQLYENGNKGGRPKNQTKTNPKPNNNQNDVLNNQSFEIVEPTSSNDKDVDEDLDKDKDLDKDLSLSAAGAKERENFLKIILFEKKLIDPLLELDRFITHYEKIGWVDGNGNAIKNRAAALRSWRPEDGAVKCPSGIADVWREVYEAVSAADPNVDCSPMLTLFRGLYAEGDTIHVTVANKSLVEFMEQPNRLHLIRQVLDHRCGAGKKLHYRIPKS